MFPRESYFFMFVNATKNPHQTFYTDWVLNKGGVINAIYQFS